MTQSAALPHPARPARWWRETVELLQSAALALGLVLLTHTLVIQPFTIPSSSMEPTLVTGDYIVVSKFAYGWSGASPPIDLPWLHGRLLGRGPKRGDVVVFRLPRDPSQVWVKRVIGLPGDHVQVRAGIVYMNSRALPQTPLAQGTDHDNPFRPVAEAREQTPDGRAHILYAGEVGHEGEDTGVYVVPAGSYFMMGDNRDNSLDSRWPHAVGVGFLPAENILGKAELVLGSWKPGASLFKPWTWPNVDPQRFLRPIH